MLQAAVTRDQLRTFAEIEFDKARGLSLLP